MATVTKRTTSIGKVTYQVKVRVRGYPDQTATFPRLSEANRWGTQTEAAIRERRHFKTAEAERHTVEDLLSRYIRDVLPTKAPRTQPTQLTQLKWWVRELGPYTLADCTPARIAEARDKKVREASRSTSNRHLAVLSHAFSVAWREWQWVESNPCFAVTKPKEPRGRTRFLSEAERERQLAACKASKTPQLYPVVVLALATGMRSGEIMNLTWDRVDLKRGCITLTETKNGEVRVIPIGGLALKLLAAHGKVRRLDTQLLWPGRRHADKPLALQKPWEDALEAAGIDNFRFHDLRHTAASNLVMNGATIGELAEILGHRTLEMVKRYSHLSAPHTRSVLERMTARTLGDG